ncbi:ribose-phosphate diphosphokinase [Candidatus Saccharibacteria bacterium]|nr:ribose-phosphate diphosphokinase [Candidatus Saccharibacteria bacterium]
MKLIITESTTKWGETIKDSLKNIHGNLSVDIVRPELVRFGNGEGKCVITDDIRGDDVYILSDPNNYSVKYTGRDGIHCLSPDEHIQDLKRIISALGNKTKSVNIVMPMLYQSRQDKRHGLESLDCAMFLREMEWYGVRQIITFDLHNPAVVNASPFRMNLLNVPMEEQFIKAIKNNKEMNLDKLFVVAPDNGARNRARAIAESLGVKCGFFDKRRNYSTVKDGKNPIMSHVFNGPDDLSGYDVVVVDDMIASGDSLLSTAKALRERKASNVFFFTTFALFTNGVERFKEAHAERLFNRLFTTDLSYIADNCDSLEFIKTIDCAELIAETILENM